MSQTLNAAIAVIGIDFDIETNCGDRLHAGLLRIGSLNMRPPPWCSSAGGGAVHTQLQTFLLCCRERSKRARKKSSRTCHSTAIGSLADPWEERRQSGRQEIVYGVDPYGPGGLIGKYRMVIAVQCDRRAPGIDAAIRRPCSKGATWS